MYRDRDVIVYLANELMENGRARNAFSSIFSTQHSLRSVKIRQNVNYKTENV